MLKLNVRRGAGASTGCIPLFRFGVSRRRRAWPLRPWPFVPWSMLTAPILPVRRPWSAVTRSWAPQAHGAPPRPTPTPWRPTPRSERSGRSPRQAFGYLRVSTDKQADSGLGIEAQRAKVEALATLNDCQLIDVVVDAGASAKSLDRPEKQRGQYSESHGAVIGHPARQPGAPGAPPMRSGADLGDFPTVTGRRRTLARTAAEDDQGSPAHAGIDLPDRPPRSSGVMSRAPG